MYGKMKLFIRTRRVNANGMEKLLTEAFDGIQPTRKDTYFSVDFTHRMCTSDYAVQTNDATLYDEFLKRITIHN